MNAELHEKTDHEKQINYAVYLLTLDANRRMGLLQKMKPEFREQMYSLINDQKAKNIAGWEPQVRTCYLNNLKRTNLARYKEMLPKIVSHIWAPHQDPLITEYSKAEFSRLYSSEFIAEPEFNMDLLCPIKPKIKEVLFTIKPSY